jgi:hypothetical protein
MDKDLILLDELCRLFSYVVSFNHLAKSTRVRTPSKLNFKNLKILLVVVGSWWNVLKVKWIIDKASYQQ